MGEGALMEFGRVVDAVHFAVEVQCAMTERNAAVPVGRRTLYGSENYARLVALKNKYDPAKLCRLNQNIEPSAS